MSERTYTIAELVAATRVRARTIRYWVTKGLLPAPDFRGRATSYTEEHALKIRAIQALRARRVSQRDVKAQLASATRAELEALVAPPGTRPLVTEAPPPVTYPSQSWQRVVLAPGLELHVDTSAGPLVQRAAQAIYDHFAARG